MNLNTTSICKFFLQSCLALVAGSFFVLPANAVENDLSIWSFNIFNIPVNDKIMIQEIVNPRINEDISNLDLVFLRNSIQYKLNDNVSLWGGYDWFAIFNSGFDQEHRPWQQVQLDHNLGKSHLTNRLRLEERIFNDTENIARLRYLIEHRRPIKDTKWYTVVNNEFFFNLNSSSLHDGGFDENRTYFGIGKHLTDNIDFDAGYQLQMLDANQLMNHTIRTNLTFNF